MGLVFTDMQQTDNPMNGACLDEPAEVRSLIRSFAGRLPFVFELRGSSGSMLTVGYATDYGFVQCSPDTGLPPYLVAVADGCANDAEAVEFLAGGTPTPIPLRFCMPIDRVEAIICHFLTHGAQSDVVAWEEV